MRNAARSNRDNLTMNCTSTTPDVHQGLKSACCAGPSGTTKTVACPKLIHQAPSRFMRYMLWLIVISCTVSFARAGQLGVYQHGTVVRMRMGDCLPVHRGFMVAFGGPAAQTAADVCPEYTLVSDKVVFVIVGRSSNQLIPLADVIDFRLHNNELAVRVDDARHESKFSIKEMILRSEWDLVQKHIADQLSTPPRPADAAMAMRTGN